MTHRLRLGQVTGPRLSRDLIAHLPKQSCNPAEMSRASSLLCRWRQKGGDPELV